MTPEKYRGGVLFVSERVGAFFYVCPKDVENAGKLLLEAGYKPYREDD